MSMFKRLFNKKSRDTDNKTLEKTSLNEEPHNENAGEKKEEIKSDFIIENGMLKKYRGSQTNVIIPDNVSSISSNAFYGCNSLTSITIPDSVEEIGYRAFQNCKNLTSVIMHNRSTEVKAMAFLGCEGLADENGFVIVGGVLHSYNGYDSEIIIPDRVITIGMEAFRSCSGLTSVAIPGSVTIIEERAFWECTNLTSITIPDGVRKIESMAFCGCTNLEFVFIPDSVEKVGGYCFTGCPSVTIICREGSYAHQSCIDERLSYMFDYQYEAFHGLIPPGIEKLSAPFLADEEKPFIFISYSHKDRDTILPIIKTLYESGWKIWYDEGLTIGDRYDETLEAHVKNCTAFLLFVTENSVDSMYVKENEIPWAIDYNKPLIKCILDEGSDYDIQESSVIATVSLTEIEPALKKVSGLSKGKSRVAKGISVIVNPADRNEGSGEGFAYCIYAEGNTATARAILLEARNSGCVLYDAAEEGEDNKKLQSSACLIVFLDKAFISDEHLMALVIREFQAGKDMAVCNLEDIEDEDLPQELIGLHKMQWLNFAHGINADMNTKLARHLQKRGCRNTATLPGFEYEKTNRGIVIKKYTGIDPNPIIDGEYGGMPVIEIAQQAFENCVRLKTVIIRDGVTKIGTYAFWGCTNLTSVVLPNSLIEMGMNVFEQCTRLTSITIPERITKIEAGTFKDCTSLSSIIFPDKIEQIGIGAFENCKSLTSITIPDGVTKIELSTFQNCTGLTSINLPDSITEIGETAFSQCTSLTSINIPNRVELIDGCAFEECTSLTSIIIPDSVREISWNAFESCTNLTSIFIPDSLESIDEEVFDGCPNLTVICPPDSYAWEYCEDNDIAVKAPD